MKTSDIRELCPKCGLPVATPEGGWPEDAKPEEMLCNACYEAEEAEDGKE
jgi:hypothetical protein